MNRRRTLIADAEGLNLRRSGADRSLENPVPLVPHLSIVARSPATSGWPTAGIAWSCFASATRARTNDLGA
jgi:hypothetical protein